MFVRSRPATRCAPLTNSLVQIESGARAIDHCRGLWDALAERLDVSAFQTAEWASVWLEHLGRGQVPWILYREGPEPWLWPLTVSRYGPYRIVRSLGEGVSDYLGPIGADRTTAVVDALPVLSGRMTRFGHVNLSSLALEDPALSSLRSGLPASGSRVYERCPNISTTGSFDDYLAGRKKKFRANWKRTIRRSEALGTLSVAIQPFDDRLFAEMIAVEQESWKWSHGTAYLAEPRRRDFLRAVLGHAGLRSEVWTCRVDGELAAFAVCFRSRRTRHYYLPSFRSRFSDVGTYLLGRITEATCESDLEELDLLQGDEGYKLAWATGERSVHQLAASGSSLAGIPAVYLLFARWRLAESQVLRTVRERLRGRSLPESAPETKKGESD